MPSHSRDRISFLTSREILDVQDVAGKVPGVEPYSCREARAGAPEERSCYIFNTTLKAT